jgi:dihydroorotase
MPNTSPVNDHAEITDSILQKAALAGRASVLPIGAISKGLKGIELSALTELHRSGCVAFSDDGEPVHNAGLMRRAIEWCAAWGVPLACHEEDKHLSCGGVANEGSLALQMGLPGWHPVAEEVMIARDIELARAFKGKIHFCHVTTARGVELIRRAKSDGIAVTAEVTPHHLTMNEEAIDGYNTNAKMSPPLRTAADSQALLDGLLDGTIDCVASDHAPHDLDTKRVEFGRASFGIIGIQTALSVLFRLVKEEKLSLERAVAVSSYGPSRAFGLSDRGSFAPGTRADVTLVDTDAEWSFDRSSNHSKSSNSPLLGSSRLGMVKTVLVAGKVVVRNSKLEGN